MTDRRGARGGSIHSLAEARAVHGLTKPEVVELVDSAIWRVLADQGRVHADDLQDLEIPADSLNVIGNRINVFARRGWTEAVGWRKAANPASHGRMSRIWGVTERGRAEMARLGVGVSAGSGGDLPLPHQLGAANTDPGVGANSQTHPEPDRDSAVSAGGGSLDVPAPAEQLALVDVPQGETRKPRYQDWDAA